MQPPIETSLEQCAEAERVCEHLDGEDQTIWLAACAASSAQPPWTTSPMRCLVSAAVPQLPNDEVVDVRPGDQTAATTVDGWLQEYTTNRDPKLRERIILAYLSVADRLAGRYRHSRGTSPEDLAQTARAGLIAALDRYDPAKCPAFVPFAVACVVGDLKRHLRDTSWRLQVPRSLKEQALRLCRAVDELHQTLGRTPTTTELAEHLEVSEEEILEALAAATSRREVSRAQGGTRRPVDSARPGRRAAQPGTRSHRHAVLPRPGPIRHRCQGRLLTDARVAAAAPRLDPLARSAGGTLTILARPQPRLRDHGGVFRSNMLRVGTGSRP
jgi:RNA polymerase sigma factor (sigma-70 family)